MQNHELVLCGSKVFVALSEIPAFSSENARLSKGKILCPLVDFLKGECAHFNNLYGVYIYEEGLYTFTMNSKEVTYYELKAIETFGDIKSIKVDYLPYPTDYDDCNVTEVLSIIVESKAYKEKMENKNNANNSF